MPRYLVIGNSGSGKSTLAARLARTQSLAHLDLDTLAWTGAMPPVRRAVADSARDIASFTRANEGWVIEGCYADLAAIAVRECSILLFLNPGVDACITNARLRPWEPHKYASKEEQDSYLDFLVGWIREYETRTDEFSLAAHRAVYDGCTTEKRELGSREEIAAFAP